MTATVAVVTREAEGVVTVPAAAFRFTPGRPPTSAAAFRCATCSAAPAASAPASVSDERPPARRHAHALRVCGDGIPQAVTVKIGATDGEVVEIVTGRKRAMPEIVAARARE